jgi:putative acetyltransferase
MTLDIRLAQVTDAARCADIVSGWIDTTSWMPRTQSKETLEEMIAAGIPIREFWVTGDPITGYLSLNTDTLQIMGLYTSGPGMGVGKALMDKVKEGRSWLKLSTHEANTAAQRFYKREGFVEFARKANGVDGIPELQMEWHRS